MSRVCEVCGRGKLSGKQVSFSNKKYNRTYELNLQKTTIEVDGKPKTVKACAKCIRSAKKAQQEASFFCYSIIKDIIRFYSLKTLRHNQILRIKNAQQEVIFFVMFF